MKTRWVVANRLLKLAERLEAMPRKRFNFRKVFDLPYDSPLRNDPAAIPAQRKNFECGAVGCAIGEFPVVFPHLFQYGIDPYEGGMVVVGKTLRDCNWVYLAQDLGLSKGEFYNLFNPGGSYTSTMGENRWPVLGGGATPKQVARNLRRAAADLAKEPLESAP